jgi:nucleoside-diphosphate-sugar epimerase
MKALVIGGTGLMGPHVVDRLRARGVEVAVFNRRGKEADGENAIKGDRRDATALRRAFQDFRPDIAVDMIPFTKQDAQGLLEASRGCVSGLVAVSSIDVYLAYGRLHRTEPGPPLPEPITESAPLRTKLSKEAPANDKLGVEQLLMESRETPVSILRFPMIYGPPDTSRVGTYVKRMLDRRPFILLNSSYARWRVSRAFALNCAEAIVLCALAPRSGAAAYNVAETHSFAEREWIREIGRVLDWKGEIVEAPDDVLAPPFGIDCGQEMVIDSTRIRTERGYREIVDCAEARRQAVEWARDEFASGRRGESVDYQKEEDIFRSLKGSVH